VQSCIGAEDEESSEAQIVAVLSSAASTVSSHSTGKSGDVVAP
jgi:hypothetical protein